MPAAATRREHTLGGDLAGGFASAVVSIAGNVAAGVIAFAPLGPDYVGQGIVAGMLTSIVAGIFSSLFGGAPGLISGPKATTAMALAALISQLLATGAFDPTVPGQGHQLLALAFSAVLLSGSIQILMGALKVGALVKFIPYPVVAGIRNTAAILLIYGQIWPALGVDRQSPLALAGDPTQVQLATLSVALVTAFVAFRGSRWMPKPAVPIVALVVGAGLHHLIAALASGARLGPLLGDVPVAVPRPEYVTDVFSIFFAPELFRFLPIVVSGALAIAVLDSMTSLTTLVSYQSLADDRFDANQQLLGQGIGTAAAALFGGLSTSAILARGVVNHRSGGRGKLSGVVNAVGVLVLIAVLAGPLGLLPKSAIAALIIVIASALFDRWSFQLIRETLHPELPIRDEAWVSIGVLVFVVSVGWFVNLVAAVFAGVAASILIFVAQMSRSPVRRIRTGAAVRSTRRRSEALTELLQEHGNRIALIELEGTVFFGSCDALAVRLETLAEDGSDFVLVDLRRVRDIDATGYKVLGQTFRRLRDRGSTMAFSHATVEGDGADIAENLVLAGVPEARLFDTTDHALEYFEDGLLMKLDAEELVHRRWVLADFAEAMGMTEDQARIFEEHVDTRAYEAGQYVFPQGDPGRSMYLLAKGSADVVIPVPEEDRERRLATLTRGTLFGEMALLDGLPRAAGVRAVEPLETFELTHETFERLSRDHPAIAMKIQASIGRILGSRLRGANRLILELDS